MGADLMNSSLSYHTWMSGTCIYTHPIFFLNTFIVCSLFPVLWFSYEVIALMTWTFQFVSRTFHFKLTSLVPTTFLQHFYMDSVKRNDGVSFQIFTIPPQASVISDVWAQRKSWDCSGNSSRYTLSGFCFCFKSPHFTHKHTHTYISRGIANPVP